MNRRTRNFGSRNSIALLIFLAVVALVFFSEHRGHIFGFLPYLLLLACPFLHFFMHRGHGNHGGGGGTNPQSLNSSHRT